MQLRAYQTAAVDAVISYMKQNQGNPLVSAATGTGKSLIIAGLIKRLMVANPNIHVMCVTHSAELIQQNEAKLKAIWPDAPSSVFSASLGIKKFSKITFGGIQSLWRQKIEMPINLLVIDESHTISRKSQSMWGAFIGMLKAVNPRLRIVGLSATTFRMDSGNLTTGDDAMFDDVVFDYGLKAAIDDGWLAPLTAKYTKTTYDVSGVGKLGGEFNLKELEEATNTTDKNHQAVAEIMEAGRDRRSWMVFCNGVAHSFAIRDEMRRLGVPCETVTGETPYDEREAILARHRAGELKCITNNAVLTTGVDLPAIDLIAMLRHTMSGGLLVQMAGRGTRAVVDLNPYTNSQDRRDAIRNSPKPNCIAGGQLVLTDFGPVPIEKITEKMKVWDGVEFVSHDGIIFHGKRKVITYEGLTATEDHKVWTEKGWKTFGDCSVEQIPIAKTGDGWKEIKLADGHFSKNLSDRKAWKRKKIKKSLHDDRVHGVWKKIIKRLFHNSKSHCWLQKMWKEKKQIKTGAWCAEMVNIEMCVCTATLRKSKKFKLQKLWRSWNTIQIQIPKLNGTLFNGFLKYKEKSTDRQDRQQRSLRDRKLANNICKNKHEQPKGHGRDKKNARLPDDVSGCKVCGQYFGWNVFKRKNVSRCASEVLQRQVIETERGVWDILNAGPRNRFTVSGLLVSNCAFLDFARNIERHGFLDEIKGKDKGKKDGVAPMKGCPECATICHAAAKHCPDCGCVFPMEEKVLVSKEAYKGELFSGAVIKKVESVSYHAHNLNREGKTPCLMVIYQHEDGSNTREYICLQHQGFAQQKAKAWWKARGGQDVDAFGMQLIVDSGICDRLLVPESIMVKKEGKYDRITNYIRLGKPAQPVHVQELNTLAEMEDIPF